MGKQRSLKSQLKFAVLSNQRYGQSKHSDKKNPEVNTQAGVYSIMSAKALKDTATNFANFMKSAHPEVKEVKDLKVEHLNEWIDSRQRDWSDKTYESYVSRVKKFETLLNRTFHLHLDLHTGLRDRSIDRPTKAEIRNVAFSREDYDKLHEDLEQSRSHNALRAIELAEKLGLRINEAAHLRYENIDLGSWVVHIEEGAKNGRKRDIPIQEKDCEYFYDLVCRGSDKDYICGGILTRSLEKSIRMGMERTGISAKYVKTAEHAIRKMYATERYNEECQKHDSKKAWCIVQSELGHGEMLRPELFKTYIKNS